MASNLPKLQKTSNLKQSLGQATRSIHEMDKRSLPVMPNVIFVSLCSHVKLFMVKLQGLEMGKLSQRSLRRIILSANFSISFPLVPTEVIRQKNVARSTLLTVFCHFVVPMQQPQIFHAVRKSFYQTQLNVTVV